MLTTLDRKTLPKLELPAGKNIELFWDRELRGFGYLIRREKTGAIRCSFIAQYKVRNSKQQRKVKIGDAAKIDVGEAREKAKEIFAKVELGGDPQGEAREKRAAALTFAEAVQEYLGLKRREVRPSSFRQIVRYLTDVRYFGALHGMALKTIERGHVSSAVNKITEASGAATAGRARAHASAFWTWCIQQGHCDLNPVIGSASPKEGPARERVLTPAELMAVWKAACPDDDFGKIVRLLILTGARKSEVGGMRWSELDLEAGTWTIRANRSKNHKAHTIPLTPTMLEIVHSIPQRLGRDLLFGDHSQSGFSHWARKATLGDGVEGWTLHDLRRSFATGLADLGIAPHVIEAAINHQSGSKRGVAGIYNRSNYAREVKEALARWDRYVSDLISGEKIAPNVVTLRA